MSEYTMERYASLFRHDDCIILTCTIPYRRSNNSRSIAHISAHARGTTDIRAPESPFKPFV